MKKTVLIFVVFISLKVASQEPLKEFQKWAEKPPMGWNSYDAFGAAVNESEILGNADMMAAQLKDIGWQYIVIDYCWFYPYIGAIDNPPQHNNFTPSLPMDKYGRLLPAINRFPSAEKGKGFRFIGDYIHNKGLKFGIHIMRGIPREAVAKKLQIKGTKYTADQIAETDDTCPWLNTMYGVDMSKSGAQEYYNSLFQLYAEWGVDYVKVDDISSPYSKEEIEAIRKAIDLCGRPIVLSLSPGGNTPIGKVEHLKDNANLWRISSDFWDEWEALKKQFTLVHKWEKHIGAGHWPDADMIPIGLLNRRGPGDGLERRSNFSDVEKFTLMSLWSICKSPLMYGGDLMMMRNVELELLTNKEVIDVNQTSTNNHQLFRKGNQVAWAADVPNSKNKYLAVFNLGEDNETIIDIDLHELGYKNKVTVRDLWAHKKVGDFKYKFSPNIKAHGSGLYLIKL